MDVFSNKNGNSSSKNLINEFRKEEVLGNKAYQKNKKRRSIGKFASADRASSQRNTIANDKNLEGHFMLRNHNVNHNPFIVMNNQNNVLNRERSSAPIIEV